MKVLNCKCGSKIHSWADLCGKCGRSFLEEQVTEQGDSEGETEVLKIQQEKCDKWKKRRSSVCSPFGHIIQCSCWKHQYCEICGKKLLIEDDPVEACSY